MQTALKKTNEFTVARPSANRTVKMDGNVAYISSDHVRKNKPVADARPAPKAAAKAVAKPAAKTAVKTAAQPRTGFVSTLIVLFIAFGALAVLVSRYAIVCSIGSQNNVLKKDISAAQTRMDDLKLKIELDDDLQYVQDTAQNELDMIYPAPDQKIHVDLSS